MTLFFSPLVVTVFSYATAAVLVFTAALMLRCLVGIDWSGATEYLPVVVPAVMTPFSFSIAHGIGAGFTTCTAIKALTGRFPSLNPAVVVLAPLFMVKMAVLGV